MARKPKQSAADKAFVAKLKTLHIGTPFKQYVSRVPELHDPTFKHHDASGRAVVSSQAEANAFAKKKGLEWT